MEPRRPRWAPAAQLFLLAGLASAQGPATDPEPFSVIEASHGVSREGDDLWGHGAGYKTAFERGGITFVPALGSRADRLFPLRFELESVRRGDAPVFVAGGSAQPVVDGARVRYAHGSFEERYDVRADAVAQSFLFAEPIGGAGELVVRGRITTELDPPPSEEAVDGLRFERAGLGGVSFGAVLGVDANGETAQGSLRYVEDGRGAAVELVLPAEFVDGAAWPLLLDPDIGPELDLSTSDSFDDREPDVAYDATNSVYLVAWKQVFTSTIADIKAQRVLASGALQGFSIFVSTANYGSNEHPVVGNVNDTDQFLVVWAHLPDGGTDFDVLARRIDAATGERSIGTEVVAGSAEHELYPDVSSDGSTLDNEVLVVWNELGGGIKGRQVRAQPDTDPVAFGVFTVTNDATASLPAISKSGGGDLGQHLVVWQRGSGDIAGRAYDRNGTSLTAETTLVATGDDEDDPDVDGDGTSWLVVFEDEDTPGSGENRIRGQKVELVGGALQLGASPTVYDDAGEDVDPAVAYTGEAYVVAWRRESVLLGGMRAGRRTITSLGCDACGSAESNVTGQGTTQAVALAAQYSGDPSAGDEALIAWSHVTDDDGDVLGQLYKTRVGQVVNLGGGCGTVGEPVAECAINANDTFTHVLEDGATPAAWLILSAETLDFSCGPCVLVADPFSGVVLPGLPAFGGAYVPTPIPFSFSLIGTSFVEQWAVAKADPLCPFLSFALSDALRVTIE